MNSNSRRFLGATVAVAIALAVVVGGCGSDDPAKYVASAKSYLAKNDTKAALIELRNARERAPNDGEIRYLLGATLLENGEPGAAEVELRKALDFNYSRDKVLPLLAQSLLAQDQMRRLTTEFGQASAEDPKAHADLQAALAIGWLAQGDIKQGRAAIDAALAAQPKHARALVVRAQLLARGGDLAAAEQSLDQALAATPHDPEATALKAELLRGQGKIGDAVRILSEALAHNPSAMHVRATLIPMLVASGDLKRADAETAIMSKAAPKEYRTMYAQALVALAKGEAAAARDLTRQLLSARPDHLPALLLDGIANYTLKSYAAAEESLRRVVQQVPGDPGPQRLLIATYLRSGRAVQGLEAAEAALRRQPDDPVLLRLAGEAQILTGNVNAALRQYERAAAAEKQGSTARVRLAQIRLATGDAGKALGDLEQLSIADPSGTQADLALYAAHMNRRQFDKALEAVASIEKKQPGALPHELRGNVMLAKRDYAAARASYAKALDADAKRISSARSLALLDLMEGKGTDARARYEKMIAAEPRNEQLFLALAETQLLAGAPANEVKATIEKAIGLNPSVPGPRLALIAQLRRSGDAKAALEAARTAAAALPEDPAVIEALGSAQLASGEVGQARDTFLRLTELLPRNPNAFLRLAEAHLAAKDVPRALEAQRQALSIQPDFAPALLALAVTQIATGKPEAALADARRLQRDRPDAAIGYALESEIQAAQKNYPEALEAMQKALAKQPASGLAGRVHAILVSANKPADAAAFAQRWIKDHPKDAAFRTAVAQQRQAAGDAAGAVAEYKAALDIDPDNVIALNNLAWTLSEQGKSEAQDYAERAYRLAPLNPNVINTYGWILVKEKDVKRGVALLRMAASLSPNDPQLRIILARGLVQAGDKAGARRELEQVVNRDTRSPAKAEAEKLLREL